MAALITLLIAQELLAERWPIALWLTAALAGTPSLISLWLFVSRPRRIFASLSFGVATVAIAALLMITQVVPRVATGYTAKRLAEHVNSVPILPESLIVVEERIGSLVFYLDPAVRRELRQRQFQSVAMSSVRDWPTWPQNTAVVVPAVSADKAPTEWRLDRWQSVDRYRLWWPHQVTASPPINKTPTAKR